MGAPEILIKKRYFKKIPWKVYGSTGEGLWKRGGHPLHRQENRAVGAVVVLCACWSVCTGSWNGGFVEQAARERDVKWELTNILVMKLEWMNDLWRYLLLFYFILFWEEGDGWWCVALATDGFVLRSGCAGSCLQKQHLQNNNTVKHFPALLEFHRLFSGWKSFPYLVFKAVSLNPPSRIWISKKRS